MRGNYGYRELAKRPTRLSPLLLDFLFISLHFIQLSPLLRLVYYTYDKTYDDDL